MGEREEQAVIGVLVAVIGLTALDMAFDLYFGSSLRHIAVEGAVVLAALGGVVFVWRRTIAGYHARLRQSEAASARWRADAERWRAEAAQLLRGLSEAIERQFRLWGLTESEQEVAFLLLKGLSLKEVAEVRGVGEKTIRNQSLAIYRKAGLAGRAELAAFFLEDLLLPPPTGDRSPPAEAAPGAAAQAR
ncbi:MAG TPA: LuxR C-terminal-related transcriptional regulator [bacterium]|nr:LuxR C-terminal-related transcriptional regulator [bacterium]